MLKALSPLSPDIIRFEAAIEKPPASWEKFLEELNATNSVFDWIDSNIDDH